MAFNFLSPKVYLSNKRSDVAAAEKNMHSCSLWLELDYLETEVVSP